MACVVLWQLGAFYFSFWVGLLRVVGLWVGLGWAGFSMKVLSSLAFELLLIFSGIFSFFGVGMGVSAMSLVMVMMFRFYNMAWPIIKCIVRLSTLCH